jgi:hypothetical protein
VSFVPTSEPQHAGQPFPLPDLRRSLEAGANLIEHELHRMRLRSQQMYEERREHDGDQFNGSVRPQLTSHEADLMQAVHLAYAAATLRALAGEQS